MKKSLILFSVIFIALLFICFVYGATSHQVKNADPKSLKQEIINQPAVRPDISFGKIPLYFIANEGQVHRKAKFYAKASRYTLWLTEEGLVFDSCTRTETRQERAGNPLPGGVAEGRGGLESVKLTRSVSRLMFIGANKNPEIIPIKEAKLKVNYFKGNDRSKWHNAVPTSMAVLYKNLYKNIDLNDPANWGVDPFIRQVKN